MPRSKAAKPQATRSRLDNKWMPLIRGAQSAIFYYISCAPYHKFKHQRRLEQQEDANKEQRRAYHEKPDYDGGHDIAHGTDDNIVPVNIQPMPQGTNKYWKDEMRVGPGPPASRVSKLPPKLKAMAYARKDFPPQHMNHQRHDSDAMLAQKVAEEPDIKTDDYSYALPRPPPVNDLHPPVVRSPVFGSEPGHIRYNQEPTPRPSTLLGNPHSRDAAVIELSNLAPAVHYNPYGDASEGGDMSYELGRTAESC